MGLKTKYQYTYFIYPYLIEENNYKKETGKDLTDEIKNWEKWLLTIDKDSDIYVKAYEL